MSNSDLKMFRFGKQKGYHDINDTYGIMQEFDASGRHRLVYREFKIASAWVGYCFIAQLDIPNLGMFRGTSEYYGVVLPRVFKITMSITEATGG